MNKIILLFLALFMVFCGCWVFKSKTPLNRHLNETQEVSNWWDTENEIKPLSQEVSEEWYLDPRIPADYVPVMGQDGLYMQVDENGTIVAYWQCSEDGDTLNWEKVNPDIPDNYEMVEGLEDVYKVTDDNGAVRYYKYIRNPDNSFTFVEVDKYGNIIDEYIVSCESEASSTNSIPVNYMQIDGNIYAVKNKEGVVVGYKEKTEDSDGNYSWSPVSASKLNLSNSGKSRNGGVVTNSPSVTVTAPVQTSVPVQTSELPKVTKTEKPQNNPDPGDGSMISQESKSHTQKETYQEVKYEGEYKCTYEYYIIKTFDEYGNLISSQTDGPYLIDKTYAGRNTQQTPNQNLIESNIDNEIMRVAGSLEGSGSASSVINNLNAERTSNKVPALSTNGDAQKLATLFAADMATYDNSTSTSPMYGTLDQLMERYNISNQGYALNIWRTTSDDASNIHKRFQSIDSCREARMNENFNQVGVAIYQNNGYYYVAEVLLVQ